jgi:hypothetical protein
MSIYIPARNSSTRSHASSPPRPVTNTTCRGTGSGHVAYQSAPTHTPSRKTPPTADCITLPRGTLSISSIKPYAKVWLTKNVSKENITEKFRELPLEADVLYWAARSNLLTPREIRKMHDEIHSSFNGNIIKIAPHTIRKWNTFGWSGAFTASIMPRQI